MVRDIDLMKMAEEARLGAYAPYSDFLVGAALLTKSGKVYTGFNIENASFGATNCAERTAIFKAISEGERQFSAIAVVGGKRQDPPSFCAPCGICRQVMAEFCDSDFRILLGNSDKLEAYTLAAILPLSFGRDDLQ
jgi:cytidine deaminase